MIHVFGQFYCLHAQSYVNVVCVNMICDLSIQSAPVTLQMTKVLVKKYRMHYTDTVHRTTRQATLPMFR